MGRVRSLPRNTTKGGILKPQPERDYLRVNLCKNGEIKIKRVHNIVWEAFEYKIPVDKEIDHDDGDPSNNRLENLKCVPHKENCNNPITVQRHSKTAKKLAEDPEWLRKNAEAAKRRAQDHEWQKNHAEAMKRAKGKPIDQLTLDGVFIKRWSSAADAEKELGVNHQNISKCCQGKRNKANGFRWRFAD